MADFDFWHLAGEHFLAVAGSVFWYGLIGFVLAFVILFGLRHFKLLKRDTKLLKFFVVTYWCLLPLIFGAIFSWIGLVRGIVAEVQKDAAATIQTVERSVFPSFQEFVSSNYDQLSQYSTVDSVVAEYMEQASGLNESGLAARAMRWTLGASLDVAEHYAASTVADMAGLPEDNIEGELHALRAGTFDELHHNFWGMTTDIVNKQISHAALPAYPPAVILFLLAITFPIIEISVFVRRRRKAAIAAAAELPPDQSLE